MPIYMNPKLQAAISPDLKKRMQGKSCFNFTSVDQGHIAELKKLTKAGFDEFKTWAKSWRAIDAAPDVAEVLGFSERRGID